MKEWMNLIGSMVVSQIVIFCHQFIKYQGISRSIQLKLFIVSILVMFGYDLASFRSLKDPSLYSQLNLPRCFSQNQLNERLAKQKGYSMDNNYYRQIKQILSHPTARKFYDKYNIRDTDKIQNVSEHSLQFQFGIQSLVYYCVIILMSGIMTMSFKESRKYIVLNIVVFFIADLDYLISDKQCSDTDLFDVFQPNLPTYQKQQLLKSFNLTSIQLIRIYYMIFFEGQFKQLMGQFQQAIEQINSNVKDQSELQEIQQNNVQIMDMLQALEQKKVQSQVKQEKQQEERKEEQKRKWHAFITDRWIFKALVGFVKWYAYITIVNFVLQKLITEIYKMAK